MDEPGLRERKKADTRAALRRAAIGLSLERGPEAVTVSEICAAAGVSPRTFFNYFAVKEEALFGWDRRLTRQMIRHLAARPRRESPLTAVRHALLETLPEFGTDADWPERTRLITAHPALQARLAHVIRSSEEELTQAVAERLGVPPTTVYPQVLAGSAMTAMRSAFVAWTPEDGADALLTLVGEAFDHLADGLKSP
ncbi:TetR family transcriptional regulator [Mangrovactinospora gilvigrisea]|uniref:acyl-CoA-like ligand-binding transcription factor n=1 Tax=Mangrovactinospora gilvigrisea TaxID=1428644 RepID=UPI001FEB199F|nr:TetR family transcriptional regulator [Mangrovactinospora gilvigrisea]